LRCGILLKEKIRTLSKSSPSLWERRIKVGEEKVKYTPKIL